MFKFQEVDRERRRISPPRESVRNRIGTKVEHTKISTSSRMNADREQKQKSVKSRLSITTTKFDRRNSFHEPKARKRITAPSESEESDLRSRLGSSGNHRRSF